MYLVNVYLQEVMLMTQLNDTEQNVFKRRLHRNECSFEEENIRVTLLYEEDVLQAFEEHLQALEKTLGFKKGIKMKVIEQMFNRYIEKNEKTERLEAKNNKNALIAEIKQDYRYTLTTVILSNELSKRFETYIGKFVEILGIERGVKSYYVNRILKDYLENHAESKLERMRHINSSEKKLPRLELLEIL